LSTKEGECAMAGIDITVDEGLLSGLLSGDGTGVAKLMESMLISKYWPRRPMRRRELPATRGAMRDLPTAQAHACVPCTRALGH
jgi:hypothetical protein